MKIRTGVGAMQALVGFVLGWPRLVIACVLVATALLATELRHLDPQVSLDQLTPRDHPYREIDEHLRDEFGAGETAVIALSAPAGRDVFETGMLRRIQRLTRAIEVLPGVEPGSVLSLASRRARAFVYEDGGIEAGPLMEAVPSDPAALRALRERVFSHPMYEGLLVTPDARGALILADFREGESPERVTRALEDLVAPERAEATLYVGGQPVALAALEAATRRIAPLLVLALAVIAFVHYEAFRTLQAVVLPLATACLSVVWAMGLTSLVGVRVTPWTAVTAVLVLSVAAGHAVQILKRYYERYQVLGETRAAVADSLVRIGPVMITACSIAAAGFASLASFGVPAVRDFGLVAACGIVSTLMLELTFIPAVRALLPPPRAREAARERQRTFLARGVSAIGRAVVRRPATVLALAVGLSLAIGAGVLRIRVNTSFRSWFDADEPAIVADRAIRERFTGTSTIRLRVEGAEAEAIADPAVLRGIATLEGVLRAESDVTAAISVADYVEVLHRAMSGGDPAQPLPDDPALVEQYLLLLQPEDLERVLTQDHRVAVIHALSRSDDVAWVERLFQRLRETAAQVMPPGVRVQVAGGELAQAAANNEAVVRQKLRNMLQVGAVILVLSSLVFGSLVAGLLVLVPLALAVMVNLGTMGWVGSWLSFATATYTAMGVSLGADFAIYLLFRLREEMRCGDGLETALQRSIDTAGSAVFFVASAIACGYAALFFADFALWRQLGAYVALMMATSALATLTALPAVVLLVRPRFLARAEAGGSAGDAEADRIAS